MEPRKKWSAMAGPARPACYAYAKAYLTPLQWHHDNANAHKAALTRDFFAENGKIDAPSSIFPRFGAM